MDVTNENFIELLPQITETIQGCDFIAIDTELSGLMRDRSSNRFDMHDEKFAKAVESSRGYFIMQFGLSCFTRLDKYRYQNRTYNFYIFPQPHETFGDIDRTFSLQAHAIQFLTKHNFDFNKLFKHGVSYLTFEEKRSLSDDFKLAAKTRSQVQFDSYGVPKFVPQSLVSSCRQWINKITNFIESKRKLSQDKGDTSVYNGSSKNLNVDELLELPDCSTNHKRNTMKQVLECLSISENIEVGQKQDVQKNDYYLTVKYIDKELKVLKRIEAIKAAKGFLEVLEHIVLNKKPLVGHNLFLDLIQIINQFLEPLSEDYNSFKETCHSLFPTIYDTKYIAHSILDPDTLTNNQSRLNDLYCQLIESKSFPKIEVEHQSKFLDGNKLPHQAGYDAYMSGYCFIALCEGHISEKRRSKQNKKDASEVQQPISIAMNCQVLDDFANKIHLSYSYDLKYFNLSGDDEKPVRNHVFYIEHPNTWALEDIFQVFIFKQYGGVTACRIDRKSALCALRNPTYSAQVLNKLAEKSGESCSNYKIYSYEYYLDYYKPKRKKGSGDCDVEFAQT